MVKKKKVTDDEVYIRPFEECFIEAQKILNLNHNALVKYADSELNLKKQQKAVDKIDKIIKLARELQKE